MFGVLHCCATERHSDVEASDGKFLLKAGEDGGNGVLKSSKRFVKAEVDYDNFAKLVSHDKRSLLIINIQNFNVPILTVSV